MQEPRWTLDELAERVDMALAVDYHGQPSGRVRAVPDRRAIRWYTTIGLIDRPLAHRGRTALYGPRHLLQLVAVKRLQARGLPLVAIQQELAGATDSQLARVARLPLDARPTVLPGPVPAVVVPDGGDPPTARVADRRDAAGTPHSAAPAQPPAVAPRVAGGTARRASFWRDRPVAAFTAPAAEAAAEADRGSGDLGGAGCPGRSTRPRGRRQRPFGRGRDRPRPTHRARCAARPPPCRVCGSGPRPPCCWSRGGSWPRPTSTRSSPPPGRCWPSSETEGSIPEGSIHDLPAPAER